MIGRVELQNNIAYFHLAYDTVSFPINHKRSHTTRLYDLPSDIEVKATLEKAKEIAVDDALFFGMSPDNFEEFTFQSKVNMDKQYKTDSANILLDDGDLDDAEQTDLDDDNIEEGAFTTIVDENGEEILIRKSTLVWMLTEPSAVISKDRLRRVRVTNTNE